MKIELRLYRSKHTLGPPYDSLTATFIDEDRSYSHEVDLTKAGKPDATGKMVWQDNLRDFISFWKTLGVEMVVIPRGTNPWGGDPEMSGGELEKIIKEE